MRRHKSNFFACIFKSLLLVFGLIILQTTIVNAQSTVVVNKGVKDAILAEDWSKVADLLDQVDAQSSSPVLRVIKGHACLALNKNNESLCMFLSASSGDDLNNWDEWTRVFVKKNGKSAVALYFKGDALARLGKWDDALKAFNRALEIKPKHVMVLNARGVTYAAKGRLANARVDFDEARRLSDFRLADAYANIGFLCIHRKDAVENALNVFNKALKISPHFALALHGRGCIEVILYQIDKAERDFENAKKHGLCGKEFFLENILNFAAYVQGKKKEDLLVILSNEEITNMSLKKAFENLTPGLKGFEHSLNNFGKFGGKPLVGQFSFNNMAKSFDRLSPLEQNIAKDMVSDMLSKNSDLSKHFYNGASKLHDWNTGLGKNLTPETFNLNIGNGKIGGGLTLPGFDHPDRYSNIGNTFKDLAFPHLKKLSTCRRSLYRFQ